MPNGQIEEYYDYLKKSGADVPPSVESFKTTLSDDNSAKQYYGYLKKNNFDAPDTFDSFANTLGLKKNTMVYNLYRMVAGKVANYHHLHNYLRAFH